MSNTLQPLGEINYLGLDVSARAGAVDFAKARESGRSAVYIRASVADNYVDPNLGANYIAARENGLIVGFYHVLTARTVDQAQAEARFFVQTIGDREMQMRPAMAFDYLAGLSAAGANAIIWTPPSAQQLQADMMQRYRKMKEDATPVISRDDVPIIDQVAAAEVSQVENMNPDVPIPDEVIERVASIHERVEEHRANRGLKPSLHGFFFRGKKR